MNKELLELASWALGTAKSAGADACRVGLSGRRNVEVSYRERKPENIKEASTRGLFIEIFVNGRYSGQSTSDLRKDALKDFISKAVLSTKLLAEDPYRTLPDPKYYEGKLERDLGILDPDYSAVTPQRRHALARAIEDACLAKGGPKVISVTAWVSDSLAEFALLSSNGFDGRAESTYYSAGAEMTVQDEGDRRPNGYHFVESVAAKSLPAAEAIGSEAAARTLSHLGGKKIKTETLPVIIENRIVGRLLGGLLSAMSGRSIQQKQSFLADKKGKTIGSRHLTLIDDPFVVGGLGSRLFDGDGLPARKLTMIEEGVLKEFYVGWYYSRKLGWEPTTGGSSNLIMPAGKRSVKEIMKDLGRGILVTEFIGGNFNSTTGDASVGIFGQLFDKGEPVQAVAEMNIAGNHMDIWPKLVELANDPWVYSSERLPSLVFADMVVSGA